MTITQHISIDLQQPGNAPMIHAVQGDEYTRVVEIDLYSGGVEWNPPIGCEVVIRYGKPDGKCGIYGNLPDDTSAWTIDGNTISVILAPQMLTVSGIVKAQAQLIVGEKQIVSTFEFMVDVAADPSKGVQKSEIYNGWHKVFLPQTTGARIGHFLEIDGVDAEGRITKVSAVPAPSGVYVGAIQPADGSLYWLDTADQAAGEAVKYTVTTDLDNVDIDNTAQSVGEGNSYAATLLVDAAYVLQSVSITMGGIDVTSAAYTGNSIYIGSVIGDIVITATAIARADTGNVWSITNNLSNVTSDNTTLSVEDGSAYIATLSWDSNYKISSIVITMGGENVTDTVYADGVITIGVVTGDVVITATAVVKDPYIDNEDNIYKVFTSPTITLDLDTTGDDLPSDYMYFYYPAKDEYAVGVRRIGTSYWNQPAGSASAVIEMFGAGYYKHYADRGWNIQVISWKKIYDHYNALFADGTLGNQPRAINFELAVGAKILYNYAE